MEISELKKRAPAGEGLRATYYGHDGSSGEVTIVGYTNKRVRVEFRSGQISLVNPDSVSPNWRDLFLYEVKLVGPPEEDLVQVHELFDEWTTRKILAIREDEIALDGPHKTRWSPRENIYPIEEARELVASLNVAKAKRDEIIEAAHQQYETIRNLLIEEQCDTSQGE